MLVQGSRPRQLHWYHAGPMLFGDWGTSRLYVLGFCLLHTRFESFWYMLAMSLLLVAVGWAYTVICRLYPDGGGVYSSARHRSQSLAVFGALLLGADYIVTAAISALDAFKYLGMQGTTATLLAAGSIVLIGVINYFGPTKAGVLAMVAALCTVAFSMIIAIAAFPSLGHAHVAALSGTPGRQWVNFMEIILAISGVEAVANMTGIMVEPVERTAKRSIWPVVVEIVVLNLVLTLAMLAMPESVLPEAGDHEAHDAVLRIMANYYVGPAFATVSAAVFATLLLSAVNTAISDMVSIQYMMARDHELPAALGSLNKWGMPAVALIIGTLLPFITVIAVPSVAGLGDLYAFGVVGAVTVNLCSVVTTPGLPIKLYERIGMSALAVLMIAVWITLGINKQHALFFAGAVVAIGMGTRLVAHRANWIRARVGAAISRATEPEAVPVTAMPAGTGFTGGALNAAPPLPEGTTRPRFMVSTVGNPKLMKFAMEQARTHNAELIVLFVRHIAVTTMGPIEPMTIHEDSHASKFFAQVQEQCKAQQIPVRTIYAVSGDIAGTIVDFAATFAVDRLMLGATQRGGLWRTMKGDVLQGVAAHLPEQTLLLIQA